MMKKTQRVLTWGMLISMVLFNGGCALLGTAIGAGAAYGIYQATHH